MTVSCVLFFRTLASGVLYTSKWCFNTPACYRTPDDCVLKLIFPNL
jgi:hypothetical protein